MKVSVNESLSIPIHVQLKEQVKSLIEQEMYRPHDQLPSVRELAGFLRINRNTAQKAYTELEQEGYVITKQGKGVFVHGQPPRKREHVPEELIEQVLETLEQHAIDPHAFTVALMTRYQIRKAMGRTKPILLFVECNVPQAQEYAVELTKATGYVVKPCLVRDMERIGASIQSGYYDLIVTTFLHIEEVQQVVNRIGGAHAPKVIACLLESNLQSIKQLQKLPKGSIVGIGGTTWEGAENIRQSIIKAGLTHVQLIVGSMEHPASLDALLQGKPDLVVCTSFVSPYLESKSPSLSLIVEDSYLNTQSVRYIQQYVEGKRTDDGTEGIGV
ncbi:GntR family transcriptional regulator [Brevibacillus choshinensis]|uniref:GntR family transcriptional regulator n=1 Tax=Brevibacillus choshinensis TaxID=54911 RepID=UPI002E205ED6|nr:GntR family transcriptional regulator [Brevibacillus choshinensis]MED4584296.1 GntR family transcriptional regulator [Brevibacillus choshinensis]MED4755103.1 GntR family transcriptional regulator [Brevibacillus choshinensis]MED4784229.1 GntR family transcriptional regulator [Brevibacillus choshinensis]